MKRFNIKMLMITLIIISGYGIIASCTHKNEVLPAAVSTAVKITHGNHVHLPGMTAGDTAQWKFDKVHSAVNWSTPFLEVGADLTGKFNQFGVADLSSSTLQQSYSTAAQPVPDTSWAFYEGQPEKDTLRRVCTDQPGEYR